MVNSTLTGRIRNENENRETVFMNVDWQRTPTKYSTYTWDMHVHIPIFHNRNLTNDQIIESIVKMNFFSMKGKHLAGKTVYKIVSKY